jgi:hypothetical protein
MVRDDRGAVAALRFGTRVMVGGGLRREWRGEDRGNEGGTGGVTDRKGLHGVPLTYRCNKHVYRVTVMPHCGKSETVSIASECNRPFLVHYGMMLAINTLFCLFDATFRCHVAKVSL